MKFLELFVLKSFFHIESVNTTEINENPRDLQENNQNVMNNDDEFPFDFIDCWEEVDEEYGLSNDDEYVDEKNLLDYNNKRETYLRNSVIYEELPIFNEKIFENSKVNEIIEDSIDLILHVHFEDANHVSEFIIYQNNIYSLKPKIWEEFKKNDFFKKTCDILNINIENDEKALDKILKKIFDNFIKEIEEKYKKWEGEQ